jgi:two-component system, OmpR family, phosphate regulon sensor histidine kinase PhoR
MSSDPWGPLAVRFVALGALAALPGLVVGHYFAWLSAVLAAYLAWHLWQLCRLECWLRGKLNWPAREPPGLWGQIYAQLYRIRMQSRARKKRLARVLKELRNSTKALPDAGLLLDADGLVTWQNNAAGRLLGVTHEHRGRPIQALWPATDLDEFLRMDDPEQVLRTTSPLSDDLHLAVQVVPYGETQRLLLARDVTHATRLEAVRRKFVANASHELRSPLTVISGYLDTLVEEPDLATHWREPVEEMVRQSVRMQRIVEDLLMLSRLEASGFEAERERVDVTGLLRTLHKEATARAKRPGVIDLELETDADLWGVESEIYSAFANVVNNALNYTPQDGSVRIRWYREAEDVCMSVVDTGMGIPPEAIPRLTERFYRVDKGRGRATGGTGLGLAIVKHALQRHGARLEIQSRLGEGSTFTCRFPTARVAAPEAAPDTPAAHPLSSPG